MIPEPAPTVRELLAFYLEAGVDCALAEEPIDRSPGAPVALIRVDDAGLHLTPPVSAASGGCSELFVEWIA